MSHTKGPWRAVDRGPFIATEENKVIARTVNAKADPALNCQCQTVADLEQCANAELIAAAPDMLAALEYVISWHRENDSGEGELFGLDFVTTCINAVRRAKGEDK